MNPSEKSRLAIVTCGPAFVPIDDVRRITNFSSGELGAILCEALQRTGWRVLCFRGEAATFPCREQPNLSVIPFTTNVDLLAKLSEKGCEEPVDVLFHAAALSDYELDSLQTAEGTPLTQKKIPGSLPRIELVLRPAAKVLAELPRLFPSTRIVGWKYELEGDRAAAESKARGQLSENGTALCVLNGKAYGSGFGILNPHGDLIHTESKEALADALCRWAH